MAVPKKKVSQSRRNMRRSCMSERSRRMVSVETPIDLTPHKAKPLKIEVVLSNSFGFGGTNASVVFKKVA